MKVVEVLVVDIEVDEDSHQSRSASPVSVVRVAPSALVVDLGIDASGSQSHGVKTQGSSTYSLQSSSL